MPQHSTLSAFDEHAAQLSTTLAFSAASNLRSARTLSAGRPGCGLLGAGIGWQHERCT